MQGNRARTARRSFALALACGVSGLALSSAALAADSTAGAADSDRQDGVSTLGEVVVTARRVEENVQDVPVAITAISADDLREKSINNPIEIQFHTPSIQMQTSYGRLVGGYAVRGIQGGTTTYFAEFPGGPTSIPSNSFFDIASVQVLNGPQGTLFGRTNTAGAVLTEPQRPRYNEYEGSVEAMAGNLGQQQLTAVLNIPLWEDRAAARIAVNRKHMDGYTEVIGTGEQLNETDNYSIRGSLNYKSESGKFTNYAVLDYFHADESSAGFIAVAYNPNVAAFNWPASITAPNGLTVGTQLFGAACNTAIANGLQSNLTSCIDQRLRLASTFLPQLSAEVRRVQNGGNEALRYTAGPSDAGFPLTEYMNNITFVNQTVYDFGDLGFTTLSVKNIFGYNAINGSAGWQIDGVGGRIFSAISGLSVFSNANSANQRTVVGGQAQGYFAKSPYVKYFTDELQVRGSINDGFIDWSVGAFYDIRKRPINLDGIQNIARSNGGVTLPTFGFTPSFSFQNGGDTTSQAVFGQGTINLDQFVPFIAGLSFTAGWRKTWDKSVNYFITPSTNNATGQYLPTGAQTVARTQSNGVNTNYSLDAKLTEATLLYVTTRTAYVPGGSNTVLAAQALPNFTPTYGPANVKDWEVGLKTDFRVGDANVRLQSALYKTDYTDIFVTVFGSVPAAGGGTVTATFTSNAAAAQIKGAELQLGVGWGNLDVTAVYSYADAKFTKWLGSDPLNLILPGNPRCKDPASNVCIIDLSNATFPAVPEHQGSITATYHLPLSEDLGDISISGTAYAQSRVFHGTQGTRNLEAFGPIIGYEPVLESQSRAPFERYNARVEWKNVHGSPITVAAFVNNITDYNYAITNISVLQSLGTAVNLYGEPRTWGVQFLYEF
jgi:iron complex outermembrane receptor protein